MHERYIVSSQASEHADHASIRVNDADASLHPKYHDRWEVQANGLALVDFPFPIPPLQHAELQLEMWGGHPGTLNKTVSVNGRERYAIRDPAAESGQCSYTYPTIRIEPRNLVQGPNALQFTCDRGTSIWGHFILDDICIRGELPRPDAISANGEFLELDHEVSVVVEPISEGVAVQLAVRGVDISKVTSVDYFARYRGYDETGSGRDCGIHGFTRLGTPEAHLGSSTVPPFALTWRTNLLPTQRQPVEVIAAVNLPDGLTISARSEPFSPAADHLVDLLYCDDIPVPFWSRASRRRSAAFELPYDPGAISSASLHLRIWDGGEGGVSDPVTLNGYPVDCLDGTAPHKIRLVVSRIPTDVLRRGTNSIRVWSDTEHHGLEIPHPGPALVAARPVETVTKTVQLGKE